MRLTGLNAGEGEEEGLVERWVTWGPTTRQTVRPCTHLARSYNHGYHRKSPKGKYAKQRPSLPRTSVLPPLHSIPHFVRRRRIPLPSPPSSSRARAPVPACIFVPPILPPLFYPLILRTCTCYLSRVSSCLRRTDEICLGNGKFGGRAEETRRSAVIVRLKSRGHRRSYGSRRIVSRTD